jgi:hypothetical protein
MRFFSFLFLFTFAVESVTNDFNSFILSLILDLYFFSIALCAVLFSCFGFLRVWISIFSNRLNWATENDEDVDEEGDCGVHRLLIGGDFEFSYVVSTFTVWNALLNCWLLDVCLKISLKFLAGFATVGNICCCCCWGSDCWLYW